MLPQSFPLTPCTLSHSPYLQQRDGTPPLILPRPPDNPTKGASHFPDCAGVREGDIWFLSSAAFLSNPHSDTLVTAKANSVTIGPHGFKSSTNRRPTRSGERKKEEIVMAQAPNLTDGPTVLEIDSRSSFQRMCCIQECSISNVHAPNVLRGFVEMGAFFHTQRSLDFLGM